MFSIESALWSSTDTQSISSKLWSCNFMRLVMQSHTLNKNNQMFTFWLEETQQKMGLMDASNLNSFFVGLSGTLRYIPVLSVVVV